MIRWDAPLHLFERWVLDEGVEIAGQAIPVGAEVAMLFGAANRDPRAFPDALAFQPGRAPDRSLLFGAGIHVCPGEPLATLELRLLVEELLVQTDSFTPLPDRPSRPAEAPLGGYADVWVRLRCAES